MINFEKLLNFQSLCHHFIKFYVTIAPFEHSVLSTQSGAALVAALQKIQTTE